ncbi:DUF1097 domain-containing protein [Pseudonocardia acaciae]|uniref:DUF1097 domain-containing protein n=1 Tax=Pseudonocardia acaciae TaxID=551276 RepID=UPI000A01B50E|nr:DUF1097 domain-containing protein [Pseudonocardia acaciae]
MSENEARIDAGAVEKPANWLNLPVEVAASILAVTTVLIALGPLHLPPWAVFIGWAGTFAMGGPTRENLKRIWPVMPLGSFAAFLIVLGFQQAAQVFTGAAYVIAEMVILFVLNGAMIAVSRVSSVFTFVPGMFFGFASFFATFFGSFGPDPKNPFLALLAAIFMNALGPAYAWLNVKLAAPHGK